MSCLFSNSPPLLLLLLLFSFPFCISSISSTNAREEPNMDPQELQLLFKIMDTMSSDYNWRISYPNPCKPPGTSSWPGIECKNGPDDNQPHVTRLDFGTHPNPTCKNTATFPSEIFHLPYLESVFFISCFTRTRTRFNLSPPGKNNFTSQLQQLSLRLNPALIGSIPPQISSLKSLQILTLSQNSLNGAIPPEISSLTNLLHLDFSYNILSGTIPSQIGNLKNLVGIDLSYNRLWGPIPETIGQMGMLQKLDLSSNSLSGKIPESIEKLQSLNFLALSNNRINGYFPKGLSRLQNLQYFIMDDNPMFISLPIEFGQLQKLQELRLANSGYSGTIPTSYSLLKNLSTLSLQSNRLTGEIPVELANLSRIYHLNLSRNLLGGVVPFGSSFIKRLGKNLDLSGNPGLCLSPSDEAINGVYTEVGVCGKNTSAGYMFKKSEASSVLSKLFFSISALGIVVGMLH